MNTWLLRDPPQPSAPGSAPSSTTGAQTRRRGLIICRVCGAAVSDSDSVFAKSGESSRVVFANPAGRVFEVLTVRRASGRISGEPTREHSWFPGFFWCYLSCAECGRHLGWSFGGPDWSAPAAFYALITSEISELSGGGNGSPPAPY
jgi:hypothetical protein